MGIKKLAFITVGVVALGAIDLMLKKRMSKKGAATRPTAKKRLLSLTEQGVENLSVTGRKASQAGSSDASRDSDQGN